jgi:transposase-like protein
MYHSGMAGRPRLTALEKAIERHGGDDDAVFARIADGELIQEIAASFGASAGLLRSWRNAGGQERRAKWAEAMRESAESHAEKSISIADELTDVAILTSADVSSAKLRSEQRRWMAMVRDRETFGEQRGPMVQIQIGELHLDALRQRGRMQITMPTQVVEAEVEEIEDGDDVVALLRGEG